MTSLELNTAEKNERLAADSHTDGGNDDSTSLGGKSAPRPEIHVDDSQAAVCYANYCRVTGTPEELILDFGLSAQPREVAAVVGIKQRIVVNYFTAKRLLHAVALAVQRHESAFGALETDVSRRISSLARRSQALG